ncbi:MAG: Mammalian cell entry protein [Nocardia sp.]|uniref:MlaD family protein n=1 Tax=Nocardia sp. TaxID=1821 RepID=UPI002631700F|nr:MlaD family protein [Nocardia sp.]MCU1646253.1 Mammalian cell entry protein [Nocardia sp.]
MKSIASAVWKPVVFTLVMLLLLGFVIQAIQRPISGETREFRAVFTDASGLKSGDDVRMYGVQVGKVESIGLDHGRAVVRLTVATGRPVFTTSRLAIRYQNLTGQRYVDIQQPATPAGELAAGTTIGVEQTIPSFDITTLFNGLQPVLAEFSPGALNQFTQSMLGVIEGDGTGLGPALEAIDKLGGYVTDRQAVLSVLVANLRRVSDQIGGKSTELVALVDGITKVFTAVEAQLDGLITFATSAPSIFGPLNRLLATLGFTETTNTDLENAVRAAFPDPAETARTLGRLPGLLQSLNAQLPADPGVDLTCSHGAAAVPGIFEVLIAGQQVSICQ